MRCWARSPSVAADPAVADREDILSLLTAARFEDGSAMDGTGRCATSW